MITQHNNTITSNGGNIIGAYIAQFGNNYLGTGRHGTEAAESKPVRSDDAKVSLPTLNKLKKDQVTLEKTIVQYVRNDSPSDLWCANGLSDSERLRQIDNLLAKVRLEGYLLTELHNLYSSYVKIRQIIAGECSGDESYQIMAWISSARCAVRNRMLASVGTWERLRQC